MAHVTRKIVDKYYELVVSEHEYITDVSGGEHGVRDEGGLRHAITTYLSRAEDPSYDVFKSAARLFKMLATRHYFVDGNKRTAFILVKLELLVSNVRLNLDYKDAVLFIIEIAAGNKSLREIEIWLRANSSHGENITLGEYADFVHRSLKNSKNTND